LARSGLRRISREFAYREVSSQIRTLIEKKSLWGRYLPAERELARTFGICRDTVRRGLDLLVQEGIVRRRHGRGCLVLPREPRRVPVSEGMLAVASYTASESGGAEEYYGEMMTGVTGAAGEVGWPLSFSNLTVPQARQRFFGQLREGGASGLLLISVADRSFIEEILSMWGGPTVLLDHYFPDLPVSAVVDDGELGARQAVEHFLELGHRRIGYVEVSRRELNPWRYAGYAGALRAAGIEPDDDLVVPAAATFGAGRHAGEQLLSRRRPPTAILAFGESRAWGVWRAAEARGLTVGRDLALAAFSGSRPPAGAEAQLTCVRHDPRRMGQLAVERLMALADGEAGPGELLQVPTELAVGSSSRDARRTPEEEEAR
jgi:LacI family transcriptional regulator